MAGKRTFCSILSAIMPLRLLLLSATMCPNRYRKTLFALSTFVAIILGILPTPATSQLPSAGLYGQFTLPDYRPRPLPYANTLWPFAQSSYGSPSPGNAFSLYYPPLPAPSPSSYPFYPLPSAPHSPPSPQQPLQLNDLIAQLSMALIRSFAQMLSEREMTGGAQAANGDYAPPAAPQFPIRDGAAGPFGTLPFAIPNAPQPLPPPSSGGHSSTKFGYGVNAGVFAGTYGGSDSVISPFGPYGPMNSRVGGSYGGLSQWPIVPGDFRRPTQTAQTKTAPPQNRLNGQINQTQPMPMPMVGPGEGSVVQIPLGENVQSAGGGGGGGTAPEGVPLAEGSGGGPPE